MVVQLGEKYVDVYTGCEESSSTSRNFVNSFDGQSSACIIVR